MFKEHITEKQVIKKNVGRIQTQDLRIAKEIASPLPSEKYTHSLRFGKFTRGKKGYEKVSLALCPEQSFRLEKIFLGVVKTQKLKISSTKQA